MATLIYSSASRPGAIGDEPGFALVGRTAGATYALVGDEEAGCYAMWKSTDGGATWTVQDAAHAPARQTYYVMAHAQAGTTIYVIVGVYGAVDDTYGVVEFDTATDTWGSVVSGPVLDRGDICSDPGGGLWTQLSCDTLGSMVFIYPWKDYGAGRFGTHYATLAGDSWLTMDEALAHHGNNDTAAAAAYVDGQHRLLSLSAAGSTCYLRAGTTAGLDVVTDDVWYYRLALMNFSYAYNGRATAWSGGAAVPYWRGTSADEGTLGMLRMSAGGSWAAEEVSSIPPYSMPRAVGGTSQTMAAVYASAGQSISVLHDRAACAEVWHMPLAADASGLYVCWLHDGDIYWSRDIGSGWSAATVLLAGQSVRNIDAGIMAGGSGPTPAGSGARYRAI